MKLWILNGPNINLLGVREHDVYGTRTYEQLLELVRRHAAERGVEVECFQSNHEGDLVDVIQRAYGAGVDGIVLNPAAYTHTSVAIADAVRAVGIPTVEVHVSDTNRREEFRKISFVRAAAVAAVIGEGLEGYLHAMDLLIDGAAGHGR